MSWTNIEDRRRWQKQEYHRKLVLFNELKKKPCLDCGGIFPPECMDFDHRPGEKKLVGVSHMIRYTSKKVLAEIAKCDLVCSNCHRIRTRKRLVSYS